MLAVGKTDAHLTDILKESTLRQLPT